MPDYASGGREGTRHARLLKMTSKKNNNRPSVRAALSTYYLSLICIALGIGVGRLLLTHICGQHYSGYVLALLSFILLLAAPIVGPNVLS